MCCRRCFPHSPSYETPGGTAQYLSVACTCSTSGCNGHAFNSIGSAFDWTLPNVVSPSVGASPIISEVADKGNPEDAFCNDKDFIELYNPTSDTLSLIGLVLVDDKGHGDEDQLVLGAAGCPQSLPSAKYMLLCKDGDVHIDSVTYSGCGFRFGVGVGDTVNLYMSASDNTLLDSTPGCCTGEESLSYGRTSLDGSGSFSVLPVRTPGLHNVWTVMISEVADKGNPGEDCPNDYIELCECQRRI